jgi:hypothetical protein
VKPFKQGSPIAFVILLTYLLVSVQLVYPDYHACIRDARRWHQRAGEGDQLSYSATGLTPAIQEQRKYAACKALKIIKDVRCELRPTQAPLNTLHGNIQPERESADGHAYLIIHTSRAPPVWRP